MDSLKQAFQRVKTDMDSIKAELTFLKHGLIETREKLIELAEIMVKLNQKNTQKQADTEEESVLVTPAHASTHEPENPAYPADNPAHNQPLKPLKAQNTGISTGNGGVPTDRQTDRQTDQHMEKTPEIASKILEIAQRTPKTNIANALEILDSLDNLKKEIRLKFKNITEQEFLVFSTIYQLEEEQGHADYRSISKKLNLTESSIRDYIQRLIKKGIPVDKTRVNNKTIQLSISQNLRKIASLNTILELRNL